MLRESLLCLCVFDPLNAAPPGRGGQGETMCQCCCANVFFFECKLCHLDCDSAEELSILALRLVLGVW